VRGAGAARCRLEVAAERGLTRFVGRDIELQQLRRVQQLAGQGHGQVVAIVGEAGVGKSRLVREFLNSQHTADWLVLESNSVSYGRATPYLPVIELLRHYFQISIHDSARLIREKVTSKILTLDAALHDAIPPMLDLLDALDDDNPFRSLDLVRVEEPAELPSAASGSPCQRGARGTPSGAVGLRRKPVHPEELPGGAHQRESVLHRTDRAKVGRCCGGGRDGRQLPPCEAVLQHRGSAHGAGGARRAYRRAARGYQAPAGGGGRNRARCAIRPPASNLRAARGRASRPVGPS